MKASKAEILRLKTYSGFMMTFQDDVPAVALALAPKRLVSTEERRPAPGSAPVEGTDQFPVSTHADMSLSCLVSRDLSFGGVMNDKQYSYGVEAYNPQFVSRQFGLVQPIPELRYGSANKSSSWRPGEPVVRARVPPFTPSSLCTSSFHEFWEGRLFSWLPEPAKLFHTSAFQGCPFPENDGRREKSMRKRLLRLQGIAKRSRANLPCQRTLLGPTSAPLAMWPWLRDWRNPCPFFFLSPFCPWPRKRRAPSSPGFEDANPEGGVSEKRARMDSSSSEEDEPELDPLPASQCSAQAKKRSLGPFQMMGAPEEFA
ncbi:hypothetical protein Pyn_07500 [Prunus yedoensis var. nudiflora]|uniref:Uncharacterized protein n=1 Tax=Prunus yedoensis var. nudiflora TaxID=2094558 RepID=A0A314ULL4_PRUYE|nr:hypothetical protein Pyn_07500 [Prunus yedoensis var. nudiflora]